MEKKNNALFFLKKLPPMTKPFSNKKIPVNIEKNIVENKTPILKNNKNKKKRGKCTFDGCNVKLKITSPECRCRSTFCVKHFAAEKHNCTFDYKKSCRENIIKKGSLDGCENDKFPDRI
tara:strand:- start:689 stop:1045 length:357 start_codon:yes stop_codon:yes gene_type:complete